MDFNINALNISNQLFQQQQQSNNIPLANTFFNNNNTSATAISQGILAYSNALGFCPVAENSNSDPTFLSSPINSSNIWEQHSSSNASEASSFNNIEGPSNLAQQHLSPYPNCWTAFSNYNTNNTLNENSSPESFSNFVKTNNNNNNIGQIRTSRQPFSCLTNNNLVEEMNLEKGLERSNHHIKTENNILKCPSSTTTTKEFRTELERLKYWERRSKNNEAAKHSRTKRREREQLLQQKVMELERENLRLRNELEEEKRRKYKSEMDEF